MEQNISNRKQAKRKISKLNPNLLQDRLCVAIDISIIMLGKSIRQKMESRVEGEGEERGRAKRGRARDREDRGRKRKRDEVRRKWGWRSLNAYGANSWIHRLR